MIPKTGVRLSGSCSLNDLDLLPEAEAAADLRHRGLGRLVAPGGTAMPLAGDDHVIELNPMRAGPIVSGLCRLFEPILAHGRRRKILISLAFDHLVALGNDFTIHDRLHRICSLAEAYAAFI